MSLVGRNDPCPCGSGKKYKKCCGKSNVVSLDQVLNQEIVSLQMEIIKFAWGNFESELDDLLSDNFPDIDLPEEVEEVHRFILINWLIFSAKIENGKSSVECFIEEESRNIKRPRLKEMVKNWVQGQPVVGHFLSLEGDQMLVEDLLTKETSRIKVLEDVAQPEKPEEGSLITGMKVPLSEQEWVFFTSFFDFSFLETADTEDRVQELFKTKKEEGYDKGPQTFLRDFYSEVLTTIVFERTTMLPSAEEWGDEKQLQVLLLIEEALDEVSLDLDPEVTLRFAMGLWKIYCDAVNPTIRKPEIYAAALLYTIADFMLEPLTQKEIGNLFGVSASSISQRYRDLTDVLAPELQKLSELVMEDEEEEEEEDDPFSNFSIDMERMLRDAQGEEFDSLEAVEQHFHQLFQAPPKTKKGPASAEDRAQELIYEAFDEKNEKKRTNLLNEAVRLDPLHPDIYNLFGDTAGTHQEALNWYREGMVRGEKALGKRFFDENKGYFWGLVETRPYMRAKGNYAGALMGLEKYDDAIKEYEEMLDLNEMDNQGARFELLRAYLMTQKIEQAEALLERYPDDFSANGLYNACLVEGLKNGKSARFKTLLQKAKKNNPHVIRYLKHEIKLPKQMPSTYRPGEESEAAIYVIQYGELWWEHDLI